MHGTLQLRTQLHQSPASKKKGGHDVVSAQWVDAVVESWQTAFLLVASVVLVLIVMKVR